MGELFYGTPGLGSTAPVATELFKSMTGVEMTHVPYKGSAPALTDLIAGRVQLMIDNLPAAQPFAESNSIRPIAVSSAKRWPGFPGLPAIAEAGVPGYEASSWFTLGAPAKTSKEIIGRLNATVDKSLKTEDGIAPAQARRRARGRIPRGHTGLRAGGNREVGQGRQIRRHQAGVSANVTLTRTSCRCISRCPSRGRTKW
jgi:tripartite-type tricarboxylate transporter receptor subunit TctC